MRGQRFAIRVELFPTRSLSNRSKHVFSAAGAAADRPAAPPTAQAAQKSQSRPPEPPRPRQTDGRASKTLNLQTSFSRTLRKTKKNLAARLLLLSICHSQCGPHTAWGPWNRCVHFLFWWARHAFCMHLAHICKLGGQEACLMVSASRCEALMKSAASAASRACLLYTSPSPRD